MSVSGSREPVWERAAPAVDVRRPFWIPAGQFFDGRDVADWPLHEAYGLQPALRPQEALVACRFCGTVRAAALPFCCELAGLAAGGLSTHSGAAASQ
jgi:hypothetical protein